jgi:O-antigen/teichoic acid export membrane protein
MIVLAISFAAGLQRMLGLTDMYVGYLRLALLTSWFSMLAEIGFSYLRLGYYAKTFVMVTALQIVAAVSLNILFVVGLDWGIWGILYSTAIVQALLGGGLTVVLLSRCGLGICRRQLAELLRFGTHLVPATVALQLTNYLSPLLLRWLLSGDPLTVLAQIGLFSAGQKIGVVVNRFVTVPFNAFWKPRRMELAVQNTADVRHVLARMCSYATLVTCQIALLVSVGAEDLLRMALHPDYWEAHRVVPLVCAGYVILGLEHHFGTGMLYAKRTWCAPWIGVVALLVLVVADLFMIPRFGIVAAAGATVMSVTVRSGLFYAVSQRYYRIPYELSRLGSMAILAGMLYWIAMQIHLPSVPAQFAARLAVGFCFAPCSLMLGVIHTAELRGVLART